MNADAGDDDEEKEEEGSENLSKKRKPWGDSSFYCPVAQKEQGVLWPGTEEYALRYVYVCMYNFLLQCCDSMDLNHQVPWTTLLL